MRRVQTSLLEIDEVVVQQAVTVLRRGGVIVFPTETFYGLGADATSPAACDRVFAIKGRRAEKALPWIVADLEQLERVATVSSAGRLLASRFWPGPLTLVVASKTGGTCAARVSSQPLARALAGALGNAITSTSANREGAPPPRTAAELALFGVDLIVDGGACPGGAPSTIVDVTGPRVKLVRAGAIAFDLIEQMLADSSAIG